MFEVNLIEIVATLSPDKRQHSEKVLQNDCWFGALPFVAGELL